ncbi:MAG: MarR family winged helix-turn-helix transcriptional regulator [bacterium]
MANVPGHTAVALYRISQALSILFRERSEALGLTSPQAQALLFLRYARPDLHTLTGLAQRLLCTPANANGVVDALERKGLLRRERGEGVRGRKRLRLTRNGEAAAESLDSALADLERWIRELPEEDQLGLLRATEALVRRFVEAGYVRVYEMCWSCNFFRADAHPEDPRGPHHCAFADVPLPDPITYTECPDHVPARGHMRL